MSTGRLLTSQLELPPAPPSIACERNREPGRTTARLGEGPTFAYVVLKRDGTIVDSNAQAQALLAPVARPGHDAQLIESISPSDHTKLAEHLSEVFQGRRRCQTSLRLKANRRHETPVVLRTSLLRSAGAEVGLAYCAVLALPEHIRAEEQSQDATEHLEYLAHHDPLTGLPNRLLFNDRLEVALKRAMRRKNTVTVLFMDIDRFKFVNDSLGHQVGDELLRTVAERIRGATRQGDTVARLGGDEFTVILEDMDKAYDAAKIARTISAAVAEPIVVAGNQTRVTISIGVCTFPTDATNAENMVKFADDAMYRAKASGRNAVSFVTPSLLAESSNRVEIERDLRRAIDREELRLLFQPIFCATSRSIAGFEALVRWEHPRRGTLVPSQFIKIAEDAGEIARLGEWVLFEACEQIRRWMEIMGADLRIGVNISPLQIARTGLDHTVREALGNARLPAHCLELELTESSLLSNPEVGVATLRKLRRLGVHLSVDDFGTGYSSLSRLRTLPITRLKIDASFVDGIPTNAEDRALAETIISMGHSLSLEVVSEGVENEVQRKFLVAHGCDLLQGYHLCRPLPAASVIDYLTNTRPSVATHRG
ncbi:MAG: bifunctional diguanylate cyclase/phosphodiesterase [Pseudomonadota bacterium]